MCSLLQMSLFVIFFQKLKEEILQILCKYFEKIDEEEILPN